MRKGSAELFRRDFRMSGKSDGTCGATFGPKGEVPSEEIAASLLPLAVG
jgi:hypothetical protein